MTREQQIKHALALLRPANREACKAFVNQALDDLEITRSQNEGLEHLYGKSSRKSLESYRLALDRARVARNRLPEGMRRAVDRLLVMRGHSPADFESMIRDCAKILKEPYRRPRIDYIKLKAAFWAWNIIGLLNLPNPPLTKDGKWPKLAAILDGSDGDMFHYCLLYARADDQARS